MPDVPCWLIVRCLTCGAHFPDPLPVPAEIEAYYADQQEPNEWEMEHYVNLRREGVKAWHEFAERLTRLNSGPGRLLEVGSAAGHLLSSARDQLWEVVGIEASPKFSKIAAARGLPVHPGTLETFQPDGNVDLVLMIDVLEHLLDPVSDLQRCHALLRPGGHLVVATCDIGSIAARYYGLEWRQLVVSHTYYWTRTALQVAFHRAGFDVTQISTMHYWDPDPRLEHWRMVRESAKFAARKALQCSVMPLAARSTTIRDGFVRVTGGKLDFATLQHKVGNQAVLGDVVLCVGRRRESQ